MANAELNEIIKKFLESGIDWRTLEKMVGR